MQYNGYPRLILPDGQMVSIDRVPFIVGQYESFCQLAIDDDEIAPVHLQLEYDNDQWFVRDLKSKTGVMINEDNVPFGACLPVNHGDCVTMGHYKITFAVMPDALFTDEECNQINDAYAKILSPENHSKREDALALIGLLRRKIETVANMAGFESGDEAVNSADYNVLRYGVSEIIGNHLTNNNAVSTDHTIETIMPVADDSGLTQIDQAFASPDNGMNESSFDVQSPSAMSDVNRSSFSQSGPAFSEANSSELSSRLATSKPKVSPSADDSGSSPAFDLRDRSISGGNGEKSESDAFQQISNETAFESNSAAKFGFRLIPDDQTLSPIVVDHFPFLIGKRNHCDYVLKKSDVSRSHAVITKDEDFYITDNASMNGTFVGDYRLSPEEPMKLVDGVHISLAGYGFTVSF